jgi:hypothetical protein
MPLAACMLLRRRLVLLCRHQQQLLQVVQLSLNVQTRLVQVPQLLQAPADLRACHQADLLLQLLDSKCG